MIYDPKVKIDRFADFIIENMDTLRDIFSDAVKYQFSRRDSLLQEYSGLAGFEKINSRIEKIVRRYNYARNAFEDELFSLCGIDSCEWDNEEDEKESKT